MLLDCSEADCVANDSDPSERTRVCESKVQAYRVVRFIRNKTEI